MVLWFVFGSIIGIILHWIQPERRIGGYIGAAILGSVGSILGTMFALALYRSFITYQYIPFIFAIMAMGMMLFLISSIRIQR